MLLMPAPQQAEKKKNEDTGEAQTIDLGNKRRVTIKKFVGGWSRDLMAVADEAAGKPLIDIREVCRLYSLGSCTNAVQFYEKDGEQLPGKKGISLTVEQVRSRGRRRQPLTRPTISGKH